MPRASTGESRKVPTFCYQCVAGPEIVEVKVENGVATEIAPRFEVADVHPGHGKVCVKAYGLIQKTYNPNRLKQPMKRTNPKKGKGEDPGFVPISWDEALDIVSGKLREIHAKGVVDESGYPRLASSLGGGGTPVAYAGTFPAFLAAWGAVDFSFGSGQGVKCTHSEHLYGEFWHKAFTVAPDTPRCDYVVSFGANTESSGGVCGVMRHSEARIRGLKRVQVEPHMSITGGCATEWVPIRPKTDAAFMMAMIHVILHENPLSRIDVPFLKERTSSPYLVAPNGFFMRDPESEKPLVWDLKTGAAAPFDTPGIDPAIEGEFKVSGVEIGADGKKWKYRAKACRTSHQVLKDHMAGNTPEWASSITDVPARTIRRIANEYLDHARIGETVVVNGRTLPLRPVAVALGKTVNNGWGGYEACWGRTVLACLVGALEVPGGTLGTTVRVNRSARDRRLSVSPGPDGFMHFPGNPTDKKGWVRNPDQRHAGRTLVPLSGNSGWSPALGPTHMGWMSQKDGEFPGLPRMTTPDIWFTFRTNPVISFWDTETMCDTVAKFPFIVSFSYTHDETNHFADVLLPECTDLESTQITRIGGTKFMEAFWEYQGFCLRQPIIEPQGDVRDMTWIMTQIASRTGLLEAYNTAINKGATCVPLKTKAYDFSLDVTKENSVEEIWDAACRAGSAELTDGKESDGIDYYRKHGLRVGDFPQINWYLTPTLIDQGLRYEIPYQERLLRMGQELGNRLHENGIEWWDTQLAEYKAIPDWHDIPGIWERAYEKSFGANMKDYPFWLMTSRSMQYSWGANSGIQLMHEVAENIAGHDGAIINAARARELGIADGDPIEVTGPSGQKVKGRAVLRQGIRPDTILMVAQFNHWATPLAKDFGVPSINKLVPMLLDLTDNTGSGADLVRVRLERGRVQ